MAKLVELTQPDGNPALVNADAILLVLTPNANLGFHPTAKSVVYVGSQQIAVTQTIGQIKAQL
jgi:hypothetical protein